MAAINGCRESRALKIIFSRWPLLRTIRFMVGQSGLLAQLSRPLTAVAPGKLNRAAPPRTCLQSHFMTPGQALRWDRKGPCFLQLTVALSGNNIPASPAGN